MWDRGKLTSSNPMCLPSRGSKPICLSSNPMNVVIDQRSQTIIIFSETKLQSKANSRTKWWTNMMIRTRQALIKSAQRDSCSLWCRGAQAFCKQTCLERMLNLKSQGKIRTPIKAIRWSMTKCNKNFSWITPAQTKMVSKTKTRKDIKSRSPLTSKVATIREA